MENLLWSTESVCHNRQLRQVRFNGNSWCSSIGEASFVVQPKRASESGTKCEAKLFGWSAKGTKDKFSARRAEDLDGGKGGANLPPLRWKFCDGYQNLPYEARRLPAGGSFQIRSLSYYIRTCDPLCSPITSGHLDQIASLVLPLNCLSDDWFDRPYRDMLPEDHSASSQFHRMRRGLVVCQMFECLMFQNEHQIFHRSYILVLPLRCSSVLSEYPSLASTR